MVRVATTPLKLDVDNEGHLPLYGTPYSYASYAPYRMVPYSMTLNDPNPAFKVTTILDAECQ